MKRDMELIRRLLLAIEVEDNPSGPAALEVEGYGRDEVDYHLVLLLDAGLIEGTRTATRNRPNLVRVRRLTWAGHEFLDAARAQGVWAEARRRVRRTIETVSMQTLGELLRQIAEEQLGLK